MQMDVPEKGIHTKRQYSERATMNVF